MRKYLVYKAICRTNGKSYIGYTRAFDLRKQEHKSAAKHKHNKYLFHKAIRKYGFDAFDWIILKENLTLKQAILSEKNLISEHNTYYLNKYGYNMTLGGEGNNGYVYTKAVKAKMSKNHGKFFLGKNLTEEHKKKISKANKGKKKPKESIEKYRQARLRNSSKYQSEEYKKKLSESVKRAWAKRKQEQLGDHEPLL